MVFGIKLHETEVVPGVRLPRSLKTSTIQMSCCYPKISRIGVWCNISLV